MEDADRATSLVRGALQDLGIDPEVGEYDADVVETGSSKQQRERVESVKEIIKEVEAEFDDGAPVEKVISLAEKRGISSEKTEHEIEKLKEKGELYESRKDYLRTI